MTNFLFKRYLEMEQAILEDRNYEPRKEDFIDKIPETIPEGNYFKHYTFKLKSYSRG